MFRRTILGFTAAILAFAAAREQTTACCPAGPSGKPVVNADQSVILLWDAATKTQHFIRRASFQGDAADFGFVVPTPAQPELNESGNEAFPFLQKLTEPERKKVKRPSGSLGCGCSTNGPAVKSAAPPEVRLLQEKTVAGYNAVVLEADSAAALVRWFKTNGYAFSPEVEAWAKPYIDAGWKFTALKIAKPREAEDAARVGTSALRLTFKTDRPLFPYREPNPEKDAASLGVRSRLLRVYFISDTKYQGAMGDQTPWTGRIAWAGKINAKQRLATLELLNLPPNTGPAEWWMTEFEDDWPYRSAPADVYFYRSNDRDPVQRPPIYEYVSSSWPVDGMVYLLAFAMAMPPLLRRRRGGKT